MNVLLTVPMNRSSQHLVSINDNGLGSIAAAFRSVNAKVTLFSWNVNFTDEDFRQRLKELEPDIFGIKVFTMNIIEVIETLKIVRETLPETIILIGGPHPSMSSPEDVFHDFGDLIDFAIAGDGEYGVMELARIFQTSKGILQSNALASVPGLIYKNGRIIYANDKCFDVDLASLPQQDWALQSPASFNRNIGAGIDQSVLDFQGIGETQTGSTHKAILYHDSRGCHARCGHCGCWLINGPESRKRPLDDVFAEIDLLIHRFDVRVIEFTGNELFEDLGYVEELCKWLIEVDVPIRWGCTGGPNAGNLLNEALMELMHRAGCTTIHYGIESGSPAVRKREYKPLDLVKIAKIVELAESKGIKVEGGFMFGFTGETVEEMNETIRYAFSIPFSKRAFVICLPLPGTRGYSGVLQKYGIQTIDWKAYNFEKPDLLPTAASLRQVRRAFFKAKFLRKFPVAACIFRIMHMSYVARLQKSIKEMAAVALSYGGIRDL